MGMLNMKTLNFLFFVTFLFFSIASFGNQKIKYDWRACAEKGDISALKHSNVPFKGSGMDLTIMDLSKKDGHKSALPFRKDSILGPRGLKRKRDP